jgi:putative transposase
MGRPQRVNSGGLVYHVLNRANAGGRIFRGAKDYAAWERVLAEAVERYDTRVLAYALMPNHWHLVLWPRKDGELSRFVGWLTLTHTQRWHAARQTVGGGHLYQGRFKSFVVQSDEHLYTVCRYVERNPLRANLVAQAEEWRWSSLWRMTAGSADERALLSDWPEARPGNWLSYVNGVETEAELAAVRRSIQRGVPFGEPDWTKRMVRKLGLESTIRPRGRPKSPGKGS